MLRDSGRGLGLAYQWKDKRQAKYAATEKGRETRRCANKMWVDSNREGRNAYMRDFYARNPGKKAASLRAFRKSNPLGVLINRARGRAKKRGWDFSISAQDFPDLPKTCPVLGIALAYDNPKQLANSATLDRVDGNKGYIKGNVVIMSWRANNIKSDASIDELRSVLKFCEQALGGV